MLPTNHQRARTCEAAVAVCRAVAAAVAVLPLQQRVARVPSQLKPPPEVSAAPDTAGERVALAVLTQFSASTGVEVRIVVDPASNRFVAVGSTTTAQPQLSQAAAAPTLLSSSSSSSPAVTAPSASIYVYLDAVDGTLLLAGLLNDPSATPPILRLAGGGATNWAVGVAFTDPTATPLSELRLSDFTVTAIADGWLAGGGGCSTPSGRCSACHGAPSEAAAGSSHQQQQQVLYPAIACAVWEEDERSTAGGRYTTYDYSVAAPGCCCQCSDLQQQQQQPLAPQQQQPLLYTTTCTQLSSTFAYLDAFQARDASTAAPGDPQLACALFGLLGDRHAGGAFDVLRSYGNLGALLRTFFGWRRERGVGADGSGGGSGDGGRSAGATTTAARGAAGEAAVWLEPQCGAFVVVNENLANLIPAVPLVLGAGGTATDLQGQPLVERWMSKGRASVLYAGNAQLRDQVLALASALA